MVDTFQCKPAKADLGLLGIGYFKSQTIKIGGTSSIINVVLIEDNEMLDEVVVVGCGKSSKKVRDRCHLSRKGDKIR